MTTLGLIPPGMFPSQSSIPNNTSLNPLNPLNPLTPLTPLTPVEADPSIAPNQTLYVKNLNDRIKIDILKRELMELFGKFGKILQIVAMKSFWRRGQAWVIYDNINSATEALKELQGHKLFGHVMRINYALEKSDVVSKADGTFVPRPKGPKKPRQILQRELILKQMYTQSNGQHNNSLSNNSISNSGVSNNAMSNNALSNSGKESFGFTDAVNNSFSMESHSNAPTYQTMTPYNNAYSSSYSTGYNTGVSTGFSGGYSTGFSGGFSDDPSLTRRNRVLFVEDLPDGIAHEDVNNLFHHMPGFVETKLINSKHVAFIDFDNEFNSNYALQLLQGKLLNGQPIKISFAK